MVTLMATLMVTENVMIFFIFSDLILYKGIYCCIVFPIKATTASAAWLDCTKFC